MDENPIERTMEEVTAIADVKAKALTSILGCELQGMLFTTTVCSCGAGYTVGQDTPHRSNCSQERMELLLLSVYAPENPADVGCFSKWRVGLVQYPVIQKTEEIKLPLSEVVNEEELRTLFEDVFETLPIPRD